jgi:hypothetical protein
MHDLVIAGLPTDGTIWPEIGNMLAIRRDLGLARYGQPLQAHNGRDAVRDLTEECLDAMAYARQVKVELGEGHPGWIAVERLEEFLRNATALAVILGRATSGRPL